VTEVIEQRWALALPIFTSGIVADGSLEAGSIST
jgi:hypothetical protein